MLVGLGKVLFFQTSIYVVSGLTIELSGTNSSSLNPCARPVRFKHSHWIVSSGKWWQYSVKTVKWPTRANPAITRLGAPIRNFQSISIFGDVLMWVRQSSIFISEFLLSHPYIFSCNYFLLVRQWLYYSSSEETRAELLLDILGVLTRVPVEVGFMACTFCLLTPLDKTFRSIEFIPLDVKQGL